MRNKMHKQARSAHKHKKSTGLLCDELDKEIQQETGINFSQTPKETDQNYQKKNVDSGLHSILG